STFFDILFFGGFKESSLEEIEINGVSSEDFATFLNILHQVSPVTKDNFEMLLELAHRFDCKVCMDDVERFMRNWRIIGWEPLVPKSTLTQYLYLSDKYSLNCLKKVILTRVKSVEAIKIMQNSEYWSELDGT
ncbi:hypothetical protein PFISCL1PPCAC_19038, partial [Pristionchus fissidentatus]